MTTFITMSLMNSVLTAGQTCDDMMATLERVNSEDGVQVVPDDDPRAMNVEVDFIYPLGSRRAYEESKRLKSSS